MRTSPVSGKAAHNIMASAISLSPEISQYFRNTCEGLGFDGGHALSKDLASEFSEVVAP
jgi:hypothetical protein